MTVRSRHRTHFTQIANAALRDKRLSFKDRGILAYVLSFQDDWKFSITAFKRQTPEGREAIRSAIKELESLGYVKINRARDGRRRFESRMDWREEPEFATPQGKSPYSAVEWREKRAQILESDNHSCRDCFSKSKLQVHHLYYIAKRKVWEYPNSALITLCESCHKKRHLDPTSVSEWENNVQNGGGL